MSAMTPTLTASLLVALAAAATAQEAGPTDAANRLTYLDRAGPYVPGPGFPRLTTPAWVGEFGVDAVVILAIDDMRDNVPRYEGFLRPVLDRLKQIDGRAPVSIMANTIDPESPQIQDWLREGLSIEAHTLTHPCPLLQGGDFDKAAADYHGSVDLLTTVPNGRPVAFRMPCCDSKNTPSPRFFSELFNDRSPEQNFLTIDSSVFTVFTPDDPEVPRGLVVEPDGTPRFPKYLPFPSFVNTIEDYPYPYLIDRLCWEFPCVVPSDWEAQNIHGEAAPKTLEDWKRALDVVVIKKGVFTAVFHPYGWIAPEQVAAFVDYADRTYAGRVRFLTFREAQERLDAFLLGGQPVRDRFGRDNGVRLVDLDDDGHMDLLMADGGPRVSKLWRPAGRRFEVGPLPTSLIITEGAERRQAVRFGILDRGGAPAMIGGEGPVKHCWIYDRGRWFLRDDRLAGLPPAIDALRLRDLDGDGACEALIASRDPASMAANGVYRWSAEARTWSRLPFALPAGAATVGLLGLDPGTRFLDLDGDGVTNDIVFSNDEQYGAYLFDGLDRGWAVPLAAGTAGDPGAIRPIVREFGADNGFFVRDGTLWWQNEDTASLPDHVDRLPIDELLRRRAVGGATATEGRPSPASTP